MKDPSIRLARWSLRLQEFDVTVVYKRGRKHSDVDCFSRALVDPPPQGDQDDDFLGTYNNDFAYRQRADPELKSLMGYLEGKTVVVPKAFRRGLASFFMRNNVPPKKFLPLLGLTLSSWRFQRCVRRFWKLYTTTRQPDTYVFLAHSRGYKKSTIGLASLPTSIIT